MVLYENYIVAENGSLHSLIFYDKMSIITAVLQLPHSAKKNHIYVLRSKYAGITSRG